MAIICVQTGSNPARHILERPCQHVRCHCLNLFCDVCFQGVYGSWFSEWGGSSCIALEFSLAQIGELWELTYPDRWNHASSENQVYSSCIHGNLQQLCKSIGRWGTLNRMFPAGWSDIPHFTRQHGRNSVLFRRPRHFEGTLATALARSDAAWIFLMGMSERESLPKQTTNHRPLESKHDRRNSGSDSGRAGKDFPKYGAPCSILSGRKWWPLSAHVIMSSHFLHNEVSSLHVSLQYPHWW